MLSQKIKHPEQKRHETHQDQSRPKQTFDRYPRNILTRAHHATFQNIISSREVIFRPETFQKSLENIEEMATAGPSRGETSEKAHDSDEEEEDYMSEAFLAKCVQSDVRPGLKMVSKVFEKVVPVPIHFCT